MQFDKWYFDIQNEEIFGYYYLSLLRIGGFCFTFTEIHQNGPGSFRYHTSQTGMRCKKNLRTLNMPKSALALEKDCICLTMDGKKGRINARWQPVFPPLPRVKRRIYQNDDGYCVWKVWMPYASARINMQTSGSETLEVNGTGYVDFVRLTIPFWKIPFQTLHWGRLFADDGDWFVFFQLQAANYLLVYLADKEGWCRPVQPLIRSSDNHKLESYHLDTGDQLIEIIPTGKIQTDMILHSGRLRWLPAMMKKRLSRNGFENKFRVQSTYRDKLFKGIMEEVRWNER